MKQMGLMGLQIGHGYKILDFWFVPTSVDFQTQQFTAKAFGSVEQLNEWTHSVSLTSHPQWHKEYCEICACKHSYEPNTSLTIMRCEKCGAEAPKVKEI